MDKLTDKKINAWVKWVKDRYKLNDYNAEEIVYTALVESLKQFDTWDEERTLASNKMGYIFRAVQGQCMKQNIARMKREDIETNITTRTLDDGSEEIIMEYHEDDTSQFDVKTDILNLCEIIVEKKMSPICVTIFHCYIYTNQTPKQISAERGISANFIRVNWKRIKECIKDNLQMKDIYLIADHNGIERDVLVKQIKGLWK